MKMKTFILFLISLFFILLAVFVTVELYLMQKQVLELEQMTVKFNAENIKQMELLESEVQFFISGGWK